MISIITPVHNRADLTAQYLYGHNVHYPDPPDIEWIIIDNGSTDETGRVLDHWGAIFGDCLSVIRNEKNEGYGVANNQAVERATGDNLVFLNNDIVIKGDYLSPLEQGLAANPKSLVGAQLVDFDTGWNVFGQVMITYLIGWCLAMSRTTFDDLGGFDERYTPADYEDSDLCYAAVQKGYQLEAVFVPLQHLGNQTGKLLPDRRAITEANRLKFAAKWGLSL
jgi:GT2 family glycosyltransferase